MKILTILEFQADFPDDHVEENGEITQDGGKNVTEAIASLLAEDGVKIDLVELYVEHGWEVYVTYEGVKYWILITDLVDEKLLQVEEKTFFITKLFRGNKNFAGFLNKLHKLLSDDPRFHRLRWYPQMGYTSKHPGAPEPVVHT